MIHPMQDSGEGKAGDHRRPTTGDRKGTPLRIYVWVVVGFLAVVLSSCDIGGQQSQPDPRLKLFHVASARIIMLDNQAEVDGTVQNTGNDPFPFDVTILVTFYDSVGKVIGRAQGIAEDVRPGIMRAFVLMGQVDSASYSRMELAPISLRERRQEKNLSTPTPAVP